MATETWLYLYEGAPRGEGEGRRSIYIGICESRERVYERHNPGSVIGCKQFFV